MSILSLALLPLLLLVACKREESQSQPAGTKLIRTLEKGGGDSVVSDIRYDAAGRIDRLSASGHADGDDFQFSVTFTRNNAGMIDRQVTRSSALQAMGIDQMTTAVFSANGRYTYALTVAEMFGMGFRDSIVYTYDAAGRLGTETKFTTDNLGSPYMASEKTEYIYAGNNLSQIKVYSVDGGNGQFVLDHTSALEFDQKVNPVQFQRDAVVFGMDVFYSANNVTKRTETEPGKVTVTNHQYSYTSANRPASRIETSIGEPQRNITYTYK